MHTNSIIELNNTAYQKNLSFLRTTFGKKVQISCVVKGNAYGHGVTEIVSMAYNNGITHFSVFDVEEAKIVKAELGDNATILVMGLVQDEDMEWVINNDIEFFVFDKGRLTKAAKTAKKTHKKAIIHIEVETGMNRTGFEKNELNTVIAFLKKKRNTFFLKVFVLIMRVPKVLPTIIELISRLKDSKIFINIFVRMS